MHPHTHLTTSLMVAFVLWLPSLSATLSGDLDLLGAAIRFAVALTIVRIALGGISHLYMSYRMTHEALVPASVEAEPTPATAD